MDTLIQSLCDTIRSQPVWVLAILLGAMTLLLLWAADREGIVRSVANGTVLVLFVAAFLLTVRYWLYKEPLCLWIPVFAFIARSSGIKNAVSIAGLLLWVMCVAIGLGQVLLPTSYGERVWVVLAITLLPCAAMLTRRFFADTSVLLTVCLWLMLVVSFWQHGVIWYELVTHSFNHGNLSIMKDFYVWIPTTGGCGVVLATVIALILLRRRGSQTRTPRSDISKALLATMLVASALLGALDGYQDGQRLHVGVMLIVPPVVFILYSALAAKLGSEDVGVNLPRIALQILTAILIGEAVVKLGIRITRIGGGLSIPI